MRKSISGDLFAYIDGDGKNVIVHNYKTDIILKTLNHPTHVYAVCLSPDGKYIASGSADKTVRVWDLGTGKCLMTLEGHSSPVLAVCWSPDGKYIASGSHDKTVRVWDADTGDCLWIPEHSDRVMSVSWSPDGSQVASGTGSMDAGGKVHVWDFGMRECVRTLEGHSAYVKSVSWSPDGSRIASGDDRTVRVWDAATGACLVILEGHSDSVRSLWWSPDGSKVASVSWDFTVRVWSLDGTLLAIFKRVYFFQDGFVLNLGRYGKLVKKLLPTFNEIEFLHKLGVKPENIQLAFEEYGKRGLRKINVENLIKIKFGGFDKSEKNMNINILSFSGLDLPLLYKIRKYANEDTSETEGASAGASKEPEGASKEPESKGEFLKLRF